MRALLFLAALLICFASCGKDEPAYGSGPVSAAPQTPKAWPRVHTPELDALRKALDLGPLEEAERQIGCAASAAAEAPLLRARLAAARGRGIEALRLVEEARSANAQDPSVYATAAEVYASSDGLDSAAREILSGEQRCGPSAELLRARGIVSISRQGGAAKGLAELQAALAADPALPFAARALGQAHLLLGKEAAKAQKLAEALEHALLSVSYDPSDIDAQRFVSECQAARGDHEAALAVLRRLVEQGQPLQSELALMEKRAGIACLLRQDKPAALAHFLEARARGLSDLELATGARLLAEASEEHLAAGVDAYQKQDLPGAEREFRAALRYDADSLAAQNHLAVVLFRLERYGEAAELWKRVLATAQKEALELPDPVHLSLAQAQRASGDPESARKTLEDYLQSAPQGRWADETRELLRKLGH
jgi:tetratricopeptide (TPR) repeat protein